MPGDGSRSPMPGPAPRIFAGNRQRPPAASVAHPVERKRHGPSQPWAVAGDQGSGASAERRERRVSASCHPTRNPHPTTAGHTTRDPPGTRKRPGNTASRRTRPAAPPGKPETNRPGGAPPTEPPRAKAARWHTAHHRGQWRRDETERKEVSRRSRSAAAADGPRRCSRNGIGCGPGPSRGRAWCPPCGTVRRDRPRLRGR